MKGKNFLTMLAFGALFAALGGFFGWRKEAPVMPANEAVEHLFAQHLADAQGIPHSLGQWRGQPLVLNFWATWCAPCVEEMPELTELQAEIAPRNIQILGIGIDSPSNIAEFAQKYQIGYPLYVAGMQGTELTRHFGNQTGGLPFTVLISANGEISKVYLGRLKMEELRRDLALL